MSDGWVNAYNGKPLLFPRWVVRTARWMSWATLGLWALWCVLTTSLHGLTPVISAAAWLCVLSDLTRLHAIIASAAERTEP